MCILIQGDASRLREVLIGTPGLMESIIKSNPDGLGLMFAGRRNARVGHKALIADASAAKAWLERVLPRDARPAAFHARYATHGRENLDNCHPYAVDGGLLMHNGVLRIDTHDCDRSDTWHYCRTYLEGSAHAMLSTRGGQALVADHIGVSNKFAFLTRDGQIIVINRETGVTYEDLWFSNTYAWDVGLLDPAWTRCGLYRADKGRTPQGNPARDRWNDGYEGSFATAWPDSARDDDDDDDEASPLEYLRDRKGSLAPLLAMHEDALADVLYECGASTVVEALWDEFGAPGMTRSTSKQHECSPSEFTRAARALAACDLVEIMHLERIGACSVLAEAIVYAVDWPPSIYLDHCETTAPFKGDRA